MNETIEKVEVPETVFIFNEKAVKEVLNAYKKQLKKRKKWIALGIIGGLVTYCVVKKLSKYKVVVTIEKEDDQKE